MVFDIIKILHLCIIINSTYSYINIMSYSNNKLSNSYSNSNSYSYSNNSCVLSDYKFDFDNMKRNMILIMI